MNKVLNAIENICEISDTGASFLLPADFPAFDGHFPGQPVLPAIVQVQMAVCVIGKKTGKDVKLKEIKKAKFANPAAPGDNIFLTLNAKNDFYDIVIKNQEDKLCSQFSLSVE